MNVDNNDEAYSYPLRYVKLDVTIYVRYFHVSLFCRLY